MNTTEENNYDGFFKGKKILIVEDDVFLGDVIVAAVAKYGALVTSAVSGEAAVESVKVSIPDAIILDIYLSGIKGLDFLENLRKDPLTEKVPVVVVSNTSQEEDRARAKSLKADFLIKAMVTPKAIIKHLYEMLSSSQS